MGGDKKHIKAVRDSTLENCNCPALGHCEAIKSIMQNAPKSSARTVFRCPMMVVA